MPCKIEGKTVHGITIMVHYGGVLCIDYFISVHGLTGGAVKIKSGQGPAQYYLYYY